MSQITQSLDPSTDLSPTAGLPVSLPGHTQLPDSDGNFVQNFQEPPEGDLLTDCITPVLQQLQRWLSTGVATRTRLQNRT